MSMSQDLISRSDIRVRLRGRGANFVRLRTQVCMDAFDELADALRRRLIERARDGAAGEEDVDGQVRELVAREAPALSEADRVALAERVVRLAAGLGPLEPLFADGDVDEVMVNGPGDVWVERAGRLERTDVRFDSDADLRHAIERILAPLGRRVDEASPLCDARLPDGSRVNVVIPPLSLGGPCLTVRRFRRHGFSLDELVANGTLSAALADFLAARVAGRASVLVSGGTGSGKTTLLNALSSFIGSDERVVTIEDAAELRLRQPHVVRLEARPPNLEGRGEVTIRQLVRNALRMRPDRIVVGEVRGAEALDLLQALNTGHEGALSTVHAGSAEEALRRIETLALMAGLGLPHAAVREQVAAAVDLVVHQERAPGGARRVDEASPLCDARLPDGSRVNVVIPPLSLGGPCLTVRRFRRHGFSLDELVANGTLSAALADFLAARVAGRASVLVSGGTGSGKTTLLNALSGAIPDGERIVTIEDAAELRLRQRHVVRLESRPPNLEGRGEITIRRLVANALRMRPDRIVVGEVRGGEALDMLMALNTGHDGSLTTVHANSPEDALRRVETLALMAGLGLPHAAVREQVASALDLVLHQSRGATGRRRVDCVAEVVRAPGGAGTRELYRLRGDRPLWRPPAEGRLARRLAGRLASR